MPAFFASGETGARPDETRWRPVTEERESGGVGTVSPTTVPEGVMLGWSALGADAIGVRSGIYVPDVGSSKLFASVHG